MIKPNELRLKNYVSTPSGNIYRIDAITETEVRARMIGLTPIIVMASSLRGIPLTFEWLLKFGFEKTTVSTWSLGHEKKYSLYRKSEFAYNEIQAAWRYDGRLLKKQPDFVHEIQNLHYALTGEELTIQEKEIGPPMMGMSY